MRHNLNGLKLVHENKVKVAVGAMGLESHCIMGTAKKKKKAEPIPFLSLPYFSLIRKSYPFTAGLTKKVFQ